MVKESIRPFPVNEFWTRCRDYSEGSEDTILKLSFLRITLKVVYVLNTEDVSKTEFNKILQIKYCLRILQ